jgi:hypothetical protein
MDFGFMNRLLVLTDLGTFKAYKVEKDRGSSSPRLQQVDSFENVEADDRIGRRLSDQAGQFSKGAGRIGSINDNENGERHNIWLENERRSVKQIAERMSELLGGADFETCYFAASNEINRQILDHLTPQARAKIQKNVPCNLVNAPREQILDHFQLR